jgi:hypothetical protein
MRNVSDKIVQKIKTNILCPKLFFSENHAVYDTMWKNIVEMDKPQMTTWRTRIATNTHSE